MRSFVLVFLFFCLSISGSALADAGVRATKPATSTAMGMHRDCAGMAAAAVVDHHEAAADGMNHDCCEKGACHCATAHAACVMFAVRPRVSRGVPLITNAVVVGRDDYASPSLARLIRPPIS